MAGRAPIPQYHLYDEGREAGEAAREADFDLLHIETIPKRSGARDWTIGTHSHPRHAQVLLVATGGGRLRVEGEAFALAPPCLVAAPATLAHDFAFLPGTDGFVVTAAEEYVAEVAQGDARLAEATRTAGVFPLEPAGRGADPEARPEAGRDFGLHPGPGEAAEAAACFARLHREFVFPAPGRRAALRAHFLAALVALLRARSRREAPAGPAAGRDRDLALRFRALIERHFREEKRLDFYAARLAATPARLNAAARARLGTSAAGALHDRVMAEARRCLAHTDWPVAEVGYGLGFQDPAYFSRFFARRAGLSPGAWRAAALARAAGIPAAEDAPPPARGAAAAPAPSERREVSG